MNRNVTQYSMYEKIGLVSLLVVGVRLCGGLGRMLYDHLLSHRIFHHNTKLREMGEWAVVTGATSGIGLAYAIELAKLNLNVILISRNEEKLMATAAEIEMKYQVKTRIIVHDFSDFSEEGYDKIANQIKDCEIGVLINNVGMSYPHPDYLTDLAAAEEVFASIINCNIYSVTYMCRIVLPIMLEHERGVVVNISSTTARIPSPMLTVYAASKTYIEKFSRELRNEYGHRGIIVQCLLPGYVATKMSSFKIPNLFAPSPTTYVKSAIKFIGIQNVCTGYIPHSILLNFIHVLDFLSPQFTVLVIRRFMEAIRDIAVAKYVK